MNSAFQHYRELRSYLVQREWDVFGTLKFHTAGLISGYQARRLLRSYWNQLDRVVYGKAATVGCRIQRWCFAHGGSHNDNFHVHFVARSAFEPEEFCALGNTVWAKHNSATAVIRQNWITPIHYPERVAGYIAREIWRTGTDSFDTELTADTGVTYQLTAERAAARQERIARAMTANERQAAQDALIKHKAGTLLRLALRDRKPSGQATGR